MSNQIFKPTNVVKANLSEEEYNRQRLNPDFKDHYYVHLSDVREFLQPYTKEHFTTLLDYGCGGSPYRKMFNAGKYLRADYVDCGNLDSIITPLGELGIDGNLCDCVLSTQVLEHVFSPRKYLSEAFRVLRPGGKLILTTHGVWEDHGCPYDFWRWTYDGLSRELQEAGFAVQKLARLTTGPRAIIFLFAQVMGQVTDSSLHLSGWALRALKRSRFGIPESRHKWMDRHFAKHRAVFGETEGHSFYLALGAEAIKPVATSPYA